MGGAIEDVGMLGMGPSYEVKATLQPRAMEKPSRTVDPHGESMEGYVLFCADA
jgi:hypothetical protein